MALALSRYFQPPSAYSLSFHFTPFLFPRVLLSLSPCYCSLMSPLPLELPFCLSKYCHQTPFITYFFYVQDMLLSQVNRKQHNQENTKKNILYTNLQMSPYFLFLWKFYLQLVFCLHYLHCRVLREATAYLCCASQTSCISYISEPLTQKVFGPQSTLGFMVSQIFSHIVIQSVSGPQPLSQAQQSRITLQGKYFIWDEDVNTVDA